MPIKLQIGLPQIFQSLGRITLNRGVVAIYLLLVAATAAYQVNALGQSPSENASPASTSGNVYLAGSAAPVSAAENPPVSEIHIAGSGLTLLRNARVAAVSGSAMAVSMSWGSNDFTWNVNIPYGTKYIRESGEDGSAADIRVGDTVTITGNLKASSREPTIEARYVRY